VGFFKSYNLGAKKRLLKGCLR